MSLEEWYSLIKDQAENWGEQLGDIDAVVRGILFSKDGPLSQDLTLLSAYFYASYLNHYMNSIVTDPRVAIPSEILSQYLEISQEVAESAIKDTFGDINKPLDPTMLDAEDRINMPGGDA